MVKLQEKLEDDVLQLRDRVEEAYTDHKRCNQKEFMKCFETNYDACSSSFPEPVCVDDGASACGAPHNSNNHSHGTILDYSISSIRIPSSSNDAAITESVCFSQRLDEYFVDKLREDQSYWQDEWDMDHAPVSSFFGSTSGAFRQYPARPADNCEESFDPRVRPWYVAASNGGPKNLILLLDTSKSMQGNRLKLLKEAAMTVVDELTEEDRVTAIPFSTSIYDEVLLAPATPSNKLAIKTKIDQFQAFGSTDVIRGFNRVFNVLEAAVVQGFADSCNTAILFITDGKVLPPLGVTEMAVIDYVREGIALLEDRLEHPVVLVSKSCRRWFFILLWCLL